MTEPVIILPAECIGVVETVDGKLDIGGLKVEVGPWGQGRIAVYVRRLSSDLQIAEIHMARHDGLCSEELEEQNRQAEIYPLGPKEYWRGVMVGNYTYGEDQHLMTSDDFEKDWEESQEELRESESHWSNTFSDDEDAP